MDWLDKVVEALAAGAAAGATSAAGSAVEDAYATLKSRLRKCLGDRTAALRALDACHSRDPGEWRKRLGTALADSGAADDKQVRVAAMQVLQPGAGDRANVYASGNNGAVAGVMNFHDKVTINPPAVPAAR